MHIKNLTNSPYRIVNKDGEGVILPARGEIDIEPHPMHVSYYRQAGYFQISESSSRRSPEQDVVEDDPLVALREEYKALSGEAPDGRWSSKRLRTEIDAILES